MKEDSDLLSNMELVKLYERRLKVKSHLMIVYSLASFVLGMLTMLLILLLS